MIEQLTGTFACPICGYDKPHYHPDKQVAAYREDQRRGDGWTSDAFRHPKESGWYLCLGVTVDPDQYGKKNDFWTANERWSQLSWFRWVRDGAARGPEYAVPEVLYFDRFQPGWRLRNFLGNAIPSGAEARFAVHAQPKFWREVPLLQTEIEQREAK